MYNYITFSVCMYVPNWPRLSLALLHPLSEIVCYVVDDESGKFSVNATVVIINKSEIL